jgi:hypothetical protein
MRPHLLTGHFGPVDRITVPSSTLEVQTPLNFVASNKMLGHGIGSALDDLLKLKVYPTEIGLDLLVLAAHVHAADTRISRSTESQDNWTREIRLVVPVSDIGRWSAAGPTLKRILNFLTGDRWEIGFRARPGTFAKAVPNAPKELLGHSFDSINLFSGGLDSLIGAIDAVEDGRKPLFVSHAGEGAVSKPQEDCFEALTTHYRKHDLKRLRVWMAFSKTLVRGVLPEDTTRGRSFLFFALGALAGSGLGRSFTLRVPENGLISLNVPLDSLRLGALSTRTTHPFYIARWNELLKTLGIPGRIENPYWNKTKGEMVSECSNPTLLEKLIPVSMSCASPTKGRWQRLGMEHCGYCLPCLIRRAALSSVTDNTSYTVADLNASTLNTEQAQGKQVRSFQYAIARLKTRPALAAMLIHKPGPLYDDPARLGELAEVYRRGLDEVGALLSRVKARPT